MLTPFLSLVQTNTAFSAGWIPANSRSAWGSFEIGRMTSEYVTRKEIVDLRLKEAGWDVADRSQVIEEFFVSSFGNGDDMASPVLAEKIAPGSQEFSDYVLLGKNGKPLAVV